MLEGVKVRMTLFAQTASGLFRTAKPAPKPQNSFLLDLQQAFIGIPKQQEVVYVNRKWIPFLKKAETRDVAKTKRQIVLGYAINRYTAGAIGVVVAATAAIHFNTKMNAIMARSEKIWSETCQVDAISQYTSDIAHYKQKIDDNLAILFKSVNELKHQQSNNEGWVNFVALSISCFTVVGSGIALTRLGILKKLVAPDIDSDS